MMMAFLRASLRAFPWLFAVLCLQKAVCDVPVLPSDDDKPTQNPSVLPTSPNKVEGWYGNALLQTQMRLALTRAKMSCMAIEQRLTSALDTKLSVYSSKIDVKMAKVESNIQAVSTKVDNAMTSMTQKVNSAISMITNRMDISVLAAEHRLMALLESRLGGNSARNHGKVSDDRSFVTRQPPGKTTVGDASGQHGQQSDKPNMCCSDVASKWNNTLAAKIDETEKRSEANIGQLKQLLTETNKELLASVNTLQMQVSTDQAKIEADIANLTSWVQSQISGVRHKVDEMESITENRTKDLDQRLEKRLEGLRNSILMRHDKDFETYTTQQNNTVSMLMSHIEDSNKRHQEVHTAIQDSENKTGTLIGGLQAKHRDDFAKAVQRHNDSLSSLLSYINNIIDDMAQQNASVLGLLHRHSDISDQRMEELKKEVENMTETLENYIGDAKKIDFGQDANLQQAAERLNQTMQQLMQHFQGSDDALKSRLQNLQQALRNLSTASIELVCPVRPGLSYRRFGRRCLSYVSVSKRQQEAQSYCRARGSELVSIKNQKENDETASLLKNARIWIGLQDTRVENRFLWPDNTQASYTSYTRWGRGEPNNDRGKEDCVQMRSDGRWNDIPCTHTYPFICQADAVWRRVKN